MSKQTMTLNNLIKAFIFMKNAIHTRFFNKNSKTRTTVGNLSVHRKMQSQKKKTLSVTHFMKINMQEKFEEFSSFLKQRDKTQILSKLVKENLLNDIQSSARLNKMMKEALSNKQYRCRHPCLDLINLLMTSSKSTRKDLEFYVIFLEN